MYATLQFASFVEMKGHIQQPLVGFKIERKALNLSIGITVTTPHIVIGQTTGSHHIRHLKNRVNTTGHARANQGFDIK